MIPLQSLFDTTMFHLVDLTWVEIVDLLLVTVAFYLLLNLVRRSRAALLLRGALVLSLVLFIVTIVLPLPAFDWLVRGALLVMLVATPIIFQPELRRLLERVGRSAGMTRAVRQTTAERILPRLVRVAENLSATRTGALIVLEGEDSLQDITETGVPISGQVTSELLQAIFYPSNPLHDGAVILREDQVIAASCVLPLTQRPLPFQRRLGTRHRAAIGLSETSDALVVVVSEETGTVSVAQNGELQRHLDSTTLRKHLFDFYAPSTRTLPGPSLWELIRQTGRQCWRSPSLPAPRQFLSNLGFLFISLLLALLTWSFVIDQTNPARQYLFENIPLRVENVPPGTTLMTSYPGTVSAIIQTTADVLPTLSSRSFQAVVSLEGLLPDLYHLPIGVNSGAPQVRVVSVDPPALDLELAPVISRTLEVTVDLSDQENLSRAYQVVGTPTVLPDQVMVIGAEPLVNQVNQVRATILLANASASLQEMRPLQALDENGREVKGVTLQPAQAQVGVNIRRRINARDVGVRVVTDGVPAPGYWLSGFDVTPTSVTLQGNPEQLTEIGSFVDTLPVDVSDAAGDINTQIPLDLPPSVQPVDSEGNTAKTVTVQVRVAARQGNLAVTRLVQLMGATPDDIIIVTPRRVDLLLSGPLPILNEIETDPDLVQVTVEVADLGPGQSVELTPTIIVPDGIEAQVVPPSVLVTLPGKEPLPEDLFDR